jgi:hypothetical protein
MEKANSVEWIKSRLAQLDKERDALINLLEVYGGETTDISVSSSKSQKRSFSTGGRIVDTVVELIHKSGRPVKNSEIMDYVKEKGVPFGNTNNPERMLSAILSNETKKKDARLKKAARGYYEIRQ